MNCLITGASVGIGKSLAYKFASNGYNLFLTYNHNKEKSLKLKNELEKKYGITCIVEKCDLTSEDDIKNIFNKAKEKLKQIDVLINNASLSNDNLFMDKTREEFMEVLNVNIIGTFLMSKYIIPIMSPNGMIINMASTDGIDTYSIYNIDYSVSKAGIIQLTKSMALIFNDLKIISFAPNWVNTESTLEMSQDYLKQELKRIRQEKLLDVDYVSNVIFNSVNNENIKSGEVIVIYE